MDANPPSNTAGSIARSVTIASIIMMISVALSRVLGFVREQILGAFYGTSIEMDSYLVSFAIPELLNHLLAGGFLSVTFIPIFLKYYTSGDKLRAWRIFSNLFTVGSIIMIFLILLASLYTREFLLLMKRLGWATAKTQQLELTIRMTRIILPAQLFFYWGALLMAIQYAQRRFFIPALCPLLYNGGIIVFGILLQPRLGIEGFSWGVLIGAFLGNVAIQLPAAIHLNMKYRPVFDITDTDFRRYIVVTLPLVLGLGMTFSNEFFFRIFGAFLGEGAISTLNYAFRTMMLLVGVFGQASGVASFPFLSRLAVEKKFDEMNKLLNTVVWKLITALVPVSALMIGLSREIIGLLFERGNFTSRATAATAPVLSWYALAALPLSATMVVVRNFYAIQDTLTPMAVGTACTLACLPLYWFLGRLIGPSGIALSVLISVVLQYMILYGIWGKRFHNMHGFWQSNIFIVKCWSVSIVAIVSCYIIKQKLLLHWITPNQWNYYPIAIIVAGLPSFGLIVFFLHLAGIQNIGQFVSLFRKK